MISFTRKLLIGLGMVALLAGCPSKPPNPQPTPIPSASPGVGTPSKGVAVGAERLMRPTANASVMVDGIQFNAFMAVPCCNTFTIGGVEKNSRWPMASEEWMDYTGSFGANMFHFRLGPFLATPEVEVEWVDVGSPYAPGTLDWNPAFWQKVRDLTYHAYKMNAQVEVVPIDTWGCKYSQAGNTYMPWPPEAIAACGIKPEAEAERYIRKAVEELGCFGNVVWSTDVEGNNVPGRTAEWFLWVQRILRDEEQKSGCGFVHMVGTNSRIPEVEAQVDYVQTHERTTLSSPIAGRWTINNERNPEFPVQVEVSNFKVARDLGLAWAAWRAGMDEPTFEAVLRGIQAVNAGGPPVPPPSAGCYAPGPDDPKWVTNPPPLTPQQRPMQLGAQVSAAKDAIGDRCGKDIQQSLALVAEKLREQGLCASGPWVDAVAVRAPDGKYEEHHVVAYATGCFTNTPNGYKGAWTYAGNTQMVCTDPVSPRVGRWNGPVKHNNIYDTTPIVVGCDYCKQIGMGDHNGTPRCDCPARSECPGYKCEERPACEAVAVGGTPLWRCEQGVAQVNSSNPFQAKCPTGGWIEVCHADGGTCSRANL